MKNIGKYSEEIFENIKHIDESGNEYWEARELQIVLEYKEWRNFYKSIQRAINSCISANNNVSNHFVEVNKMVKIGSQTTRKLVDYKLSRYGCYLIALNGDIKKEIIGLAQSYFIVQTRKIEVLEKELTNLSEDEKRIIERRKVKSGNYSLEQTAKKSGVKNFASFHNAGYRGLYNGETADDIAKRKKLRYREEILDNMGSEELVDNWFRIIHTEAKLKRDKIDNPYDANATHYSVGKKVRKIIREMGGTMPEELPTPKSSVKELDNK